MSLTGSASVTQATVGQPVTFSFTATNAGTAYHRQAIFSLSLSKPDTITSATIDFGTCKISKTRLGLTCTRKPFDIGSTFHVTVVALASGEEDLTATSTLFTNDASAGMQDVSLDVPVYAVDNTAPSGVKATTPGSVTLKSSFPMRWRATDTGSGVSTMSVRERAASWHGPFGPYQVWQNGAGPRHADFPGAPGFTYCFSAMATDHQGNASGWSPDACVAIPLKATALHRHGAWTAQSASDAYGGTYVLSDVAGASLTLPGVQAKRVDIVVQECAQCGAIQVSLGGSPIGQFGLRSKSRSWQVLPVLIGGHALRTGTLTLRVVSHGRPVQVAGVAVARAVNSVR